MGFDSRKETTRSGEDQPKKGEGPRGTWHGKESESGRGQGAPGACGEGAGEVNKSNPLV